MPLQHAIANQAFAQPLRGRECVHRHVTVEHHKLHECFCLGTRTYPDVLAKFWVHRSGQQLPVALSCHREPKTVSERSFNRCACLHLAQLSLHPLALMLQSHAVCMRLCVLAD